jgi:hypothetical protein
LNILPSMKSLFLTSEARFPSVFAFLNTGRICRLFFCTTFGNCSPIENCVCLSLFQLFLINSRCWKIRHFVTMGLVFPNFRGPNLCSV